GAGQPVLSDSGVAGRGSGTREVVDEQPEKGASEGLEDGFSLRAESETDANADQPAEIDTARVNVEPNDGTAVVEQDLELSSRAGCGSVERREEIASPAWDAPPRPHARCVRRPDAVEVGGTPSRPRQARPCRDRHRPGQLGRGFWD